MYVKPFCYEFHILNWKTVNGGDMEGSQFLWILKLTVELFDLGKLRDIIRARLSFSTINCKNVPLRFLNQ